MPGPYDGEVRGMAGVMSRLLRSRLVQLLLLTILLGIIYSFYYAGAKNNFSNENTKFYHNDKFEEKVKQEVRDQLKPPKLPTDDNTQDKLTKDKKETVNMKQGEIKETEEKKETVKNVAEKTLKSQGRDSPDKKKTESENEDGTKSKKDNQSEINVIITFTNARDNHNLQQKFRVTVSSLLKQSSVPLAIFIIGDDESRKIAAKILNEVAPSASIYRLVNLDVDKLAKDLDEIVRPMQQHFSYKPGAYYSHALFFLSIAMHRVMPETMKRVIMIDCDLKFRADIKKLYNRFDLFTDDNIIGIAREMQPVYRHAFWQYRNGHPGTRVGEPPPNGLTGFNSGVLLLHLEHMRKSKLYNSLINADAVKQLTQEYMFKGHLGDQDFFTLVNMKYEKLFHVLPCSWNRQLCQWWRDKGYEDIFPSYFDCKEYINVYHGNCNTPIPND